MTKPTTREGLESAFSRIKEYATPRLKRLLVVEDDPAEQLSIRELLGYRDIQVSLAASGQEALNAINSEPFDCMVLDLRLPDMSGFDVLDFIRKQPGLRQMPVIIFSSSSDPKDVRRALHTIRRTYAIMRQANALIFSTPYLAKLAARSFRSADIFACSPPSR